MHLECHAMLGWAIGVLGAAPEDHRLRRYCTVAAMLPDVDAVSYLFGTDAYVNYHHTFGHNVFLLLITTGYAAYRLRTCRACGLVFLAFASHLLTDGWFSGSDLYLFWPVWDRGFLFEHSVGLEHPINIQLMYVGFALVILLAAVYRHTPIELFSPRLDQRFMSALTPRRANCHSCGGKANQHCVGCGKAVCWRHATLTRAFDVLCPKCRTSGNDSRPKGV